MPAVEAWRPEALGGPRVVGLATVAKLEANAPPRGARAG